MTKRLRANRPSGNWRGAVAHFRDEQITSNAEVLLRCSEVNAAYGQLQVLFGIDLVVHQGDLVALLGTNGAGKSSLLRSLTGLLPASRGTITFAGDNITRWSTERIVANGLSMMPGGRGIFPSLTVEENLRVAAWPMRRDKAMATSARRRATELFPILASRSSQVAGELSGGEQQMLSLSMAFLVRPRLLCIDELSLGLAPTVVATLVDAVREFHRQGTTIVIVEQSVSVALLLAERATFLEKGQVRFSGETDQLLGRPDLLRSIFIGGSDSAENASDGVLLSQVGANHQSNGSTVNGRESLLGPASSDDTEPPIDAALECRGLTKYFGGINAVDGVDLSVRSGEVVGLIGHNGAGKTTLFDLISGFLVSNGGLIMIDGEDVTDFPAHERAVAGLGRSFQEARLFPTLTVIETISIALERHLARRGPLSAAFRMPASTDLEADIGDQVDGLIETLGLGAYRHRPTGELSTGTRRIVELACILAQRPSLVLLDEPSGGIAQAESEALAPLLRRVVQQTGCAMIIIEHDMALVSALCDRLVALELGSVIASGSPSEVLSHPKVIASYLGTDDVPSTSSIE